MYKYVFVVVFLMSFSNTSINVRPEIAVGKDVNGNRALEIIPLRTSWTPVPEWAFKLGYSVNYTMARSGGAWNHYSQGIMAKVEYKPLNFLENWIGNNTLNDLTVSFEKSFSSKYDGANNDVSYILSGPYERTGIGFNIVW